MNDIAMSVVIINWENMFDDKFVQPRVFLNIYIYICCLMGMFNGKGIILIYSMDSVGIFHGES